MKKIAIFASGSGTNAENIIRYFANHPSDAVELVLTNKNDAYVIQRAKKLGVKSIIFDRDDLYNTDNVLSVLQENNIYFVVLAGFLWLLPEKIITKYRNKIVNIHPALLPKYGGKGMYGDNVHKTVIKNKENESGITIHFVNNEYDSGKIIFQTKCSISPEDSYIHLAQKIHKLEYHYYPLCIEKILSEI